YPSPAPNTGSTCAICRIIARAVTALSVGGRSSHQHYHQQYRAGDRRDHRIDMNAQNGSSDIRAQIVALARDLEFDLCRFARADAPEHALQFRQWLDRGEGGEMNYLARNAEKRCDPQQVLPKAKTVIVLALNYFQGEAAETTVLAMPTRGAGGSPTGKNTRNSRGAGFHKIIEKESTRTRHVP